MVKLSRLPGPPLSKHSSVGALLAKGVNVAIGTVDEAEARNARFEIAWVSPNLSCNCLLVMLNSLPPTY